MKKRILTLITAVLMLFNLMPLSAFADGTSDKYTEKADEVLSHLALSGSEPKFGTNGGEWTVIALARGGYYAPENKYFSDYYKRIVETVKTEAASVNMNGALHRNKSSENARLIMALAAIGMDPQNVGGIDLIDAYSANGIGWITRQGINGAIYALIALDTNGYKTSDETIRQKCIEVILKNEKANGGWALSGTAADPDITAMALQALAQYRDDDKVNAAAERAFDALSAMQKSDGGFASWGTVNCESVAQVIIACTAGGIDPQSDSRFVKEGGAPLDAMFGFYDGNGGFKHTKTGPTDGMASDQAACALAAYCRFKSGKTRLYDTSDQPSLVIAGDASGDNEKADFKRAVRKSGGF